MTCKNIFTFIQNVQVYKIHINHTRNHFQQNLTCDKSHFKILDMQYILLTLEKNVITRLEKKYHS